MYRIPKDLDLSKAVGEFTTQIRVGQFDMQFDFGDVSFAVQSPITLLDDGKVIAKWQEDSWPEEGFLRIFNVPISKIQVPDDRTIIIEFENKVEMHLVDSSDQYESMQITIKGGTGVIVI